MLFRSGPDEESPESEAGREDSPAPLANEEPVENESPVAFEEDLPGEDAIPESGAAATSPRDAEEVDAEDADVQPDDRAVDATDAVTGQDGEEPPSSTAWRSFTAAHRRGAAPPRRPQASLSERLQ
mgnify:CR=1 FL=1